MKTNYSIIKSIVRLASVVFMMVVGIGNMWGTDVTWDYSLDAISDVTKGQITVTYAQNDGTNAVAISSDLLRLYRQSASPYNGCTAKWTAASGYQITAIQVVFDGGRTAARGKIDNGDYADVFSGGNSKTITISSLTATSYTIQNQASSSTTVTISSVKITYEATCDKSVTVSNGSSSTNGSITSIVTSPVKTCSATAADRQVSIVVTPSTGYVAPTDLTAASSTGTVNASKISRTDNGNGTFTFVYQFAQNDNGTITYNAACVGNQYTVTFDKQSGSGGSDEVTATYDDEMPSATMPTRSGYNFEGYFTETGGAGTQYYNADGSSANDWNEAANTTLYAYWTAKSYTDYRFSCGELTLTPKLVTASTPIFITSTAGDKWVRSADSILVEGSGLSASQTVTFSLSDPTLSDVFRVRKKDFTELQTNSSGSFDANTYVYIFYKPASGSTSDGLDKLTNITATVGGSKPKKATLTQSIMGRHLPADFVIAAKNTTTNKWYALPNPSTDLGNPEPVEIAVDDINNPTVAYTASSNIFRLRGLDETGTYKLSQYGEWVKLGMPNKSNYPLFGSTEHTIKSDNGSSYTSNIGKQYWWQPVQTNTSVTNAQDAKYTIKMANNSYTLSAWWSASGGPKWGLYAGGNGEHTLRLIPASSTTFTEAYFVEWGQHGGVIEVDATGIDATSVVAHLNGKTSSAITLSQTLSSGEKATKYNYTVNFSSGIDFAAAASNGALLMLEWKKGETIKAMTSLVVPKIIAASSTLSSHGASDGDWSSAEVHVLPGVTLTANAGDFTSYDVMIKHLEIYPGATVVVTKGEQANGTLKVKTLVMRNGWTRAGSKNYDVARLYITPTTASLAKNATDDVWYADWYIDYDQYYPVAVPWDVTLANIKYRYCTVDPSVGYGNNIRLRYYDGAGRAAGTNAGSSNWKDYGKDGNLSVPAKLVPSQGYVMSAKRPTGKAFAIIRMPLTIPSSDWTAAGEQGNVSTTYKNKVSVTAHGVGGSAPWYAQGWNFIANPYMALFNGDDTGITGKLLVQSGGSVKYATIPDTEFKNFDQLNIAEAKLKPSSGFMVQVATDGELVFSNGNIVASTPARYTNEQEAIPEQEAYIRLSNNEGSDQMGLIIGSGYTANYEINADLSKMLGEANTVKTYMRYTDMDMAYVAINEQLARAEIPVTVRIPADGEYTYSLTNSSTVDELEGLYLIDYLTGVTTNLLFDDYTFTAEAGTISDRFAINAIVGERKVPTGADVTGLDKNSSEPIKFIWHDKVYILHQNVIYDATGKKVNVISK